MTILDYLFDFYYNLFDSFDGNVLSIKFDTNSVFSGLSMDITEYFAYTLSWITIILFVIVFIKIAIWLFKMGANLFKW